MEKDYATIVAEMEPLVQAYAPVHDAVKAGTATPSQKALFEEKRGAVASMLQPAWDEFQALQPKVQDGSATTEEHAQYKEAQQLAADLRQAHREAEIRAGIRGPGHGVAGAAPSGGGGN